MKENTPIVVGITGHPGTGKSTISRLLRFLNVPVQESDRVVNELLSKEEIILQLGNKFPQAVIQGGIDRQVLAKIVFGDHDKLAYLESILHPLVYKEHKKFIKDHGGRPLSVVEIPLLYETGGEAFCDFIVYTICPEPILQQRILKRGWTQTRYKNILKRLLPDEVKQAKADFIIDTGTSKLKTWHQLRDVLQTICNRGKKETDA